MPLTLHNTLTRKKEPFKPLIAGQVRIYNCGPTVYDYAHIGNFRAYVFADLLKRYLKYRGFTVRQVMNITDVGHLTNDDDEGEDKLEVGSKREKLDPWQLAKKYMNFFFEDRDRLNLDPADKYPRATDHIPQMIDMISTLIEKGFAYEVNGCVYYDITKFPSYGQLSGNTMDDLEVGKRIEVNPDKKNPRDFALWVSDPSHIMQWDSPWGRGYPGWHIECSAMSIHHLGKTLDIHTGGEDNIFPHHECEIAQAEGTTGKPFVRYWMHNGYLQVDGKKMSKSAGNFYTLRDLMKKGYDPIDVRFVLLSTHYRQQLNFTLEGIDAARESRRRLSDLLARMDEVTKKEDSGTIHKLVNSARNNFRKALDDDLNISAALGAIFDFVRDVNKTDVGKKEAELVSETLHKFDTVLGVLDTADDIPEEVLEMAQARQQARADKNFDEADRFRKEIQNRGYIVEDTPDGPRCKKI